MGKRINAQAHGDNEYVKAVLRQVESSKSQFDVVVPFYSPNKYEMKVCYMHSSSPTIKQYIQWLSWV